ncbi:unnamed protein product, partial [Pylaiella littoralis]
TTTKNKGQKQAFQASRSKRKPSQLICSVATITARARAPFCPPFGGGLGERNLKHEGEHKKYGFGGKKDHSDPHSRNYLSNYNPEEGGFGGSKLKPAGFQP